MTERARDRPKKYGANAPQLRAISPIEENISLLDWMVHPCKHYNRNRKKC